MKLLFDHNLSPRLVARFADLYPHSSHLYFLGLDQANDRNVWQYAGDNEYIIVTKDADFYDLAILLGYPPKLIWIRVGNCTTSEVEVLLRSRYDDIVVLSQDVSLRILVL
jgi:predicted nuclease of predicted toxin-antitoxin system